MAIIRFTDKPFFRTPWTEIDRMRQEMESHFRHLMGGNYGLPESTAFPPLNIFEGEETIVVTAEVAGVRPEVISVSVEGDTLSISGVRESVTDKVSYHRREIQSGTFSRAVSLPAKVAVDRITAKTANGILTIQLPKAEEAKPRRITVQTA